MAISINNSINPVKVLFNDKNCTEVYYTNASMDSPVKVWPDEPKKYYLRYLWYPSDGQPKFSQLCIATRPYADVTVKYGKNSNDSRWWDMLFSYDSPQTLTTTIIDKLSSWDFYQWADDNVTDKTNPNRTDILDDRYTDPEHPLLIACWFKGPSQSTSSLPPLPGTEPTPTPVVDKATITVKSYTNFGSLKATLDGVSVLAPINKIKQGTVDHPFTRNYVMDVVLGQNSSGVQYTLDKVAFTTSGVYEQITFNSSSSKFRVGFANDRWYVSNFKQRIYINGTEEIESFKNIGIEDGYTTWSSSSKPYEYCLSFTMY